MLTVALALREQYIAIHARHGDFKNYCGDYSLEDCFASMDVYARRVAEIQEEAMERYGVVPEHVIMLSDEKDPLWWDQVRERGWYLVEAEITADILETHNSWCVRVIYGIFVVCVCFRSFFLSCACVRTGILYSLTL